MQLSDLLKAANIAVQHAPAGITGITADSRQVQPGYLFVALRGTKEDGGQYIADAKARGAVAIVCDSTGGQLLPPLTGGESEAERSKRGENIIHIPNARLALSKLAAAFYPEQPEWMVAVTGTDGKTSTTQFFQQFWTLLGQKSAAIGTIGITGAEAVNGLSSAQTTPDPVTLHRVLQHLAQASVQRVAMEASSHGLDQRRLDGVRLKAAAFTTFTRDHLDYHGTLDAYFMAKARLFKELLPREGGAVLNADDDAIMGLEESCRKRGQHVFTFGRKSRHYQLLQITPTVSGQTLHVDIHRTPYIFGLPLYGAFQAMNVLAAMALAEACGSSPKQLAGVVESLTSVRGRLERAAVHPSGAPIFVDYAHTPDGLTNVLTSIRPHAVGRLHLVFGCGGDRDPGKRGPMGKVASQLADTVIVTDDNPRSEDPAKIRQAILLQCSNAKEIGDRAEAIYAAVQQLRAGDVLVIAGKGHETTQAVGDRVLPFNDADVARAAVEAL